MDVGKNIAPLRCFFALIWCEFQKHCTATNGGFDKTEHSTMLLGKNMVIVAKNKLARILLKSTRRDRVNFNCQSGF
jgi:hypothetical protein